MSTVPEQQSEVNLVEQARRQINRLADEIAQMSESDMGPSEYYGEFLQRVLQALAAPAGAVWLLTQQGNLQLQYQINMRDVGLDRSEEGREGHDELLRQTLARPQPFMVPPRSGRGVAEPKRAAPGNPTDYLVLMAPIMVDKTVAGLVEVWQDPKRGPDAQRGFLTFLIRMAGLAGGYARNHQLRQMVGQQQVWTQLEAFARQIHNSLNPTEVAYIIANEGRRLVECDRISVGIRRGKKTKMEAISGADVVEKRSNLVQLMRKLFDAVLKWGEKLVFTGTKDDSLPPNVLKALDDYLAESTSKMLVLLPLRDDRETNTKRPPRSGLMMESFDPATSPEQMVARLEVIGKHATMALYNATEHKNIPFRFVWQPIAKVQEGLGGKAKAITGAVLISLMILVAAMIVVPYPLKMEAAGQVWPKERLYVFPPVSGKVLGFAPRVKPGARVSKDEELIHMQCPDLAPEITKLNIEIETLIKQLGQNESQTNSLDPRVVFQARMKIVDLTGALHSTQAQLKNLQSLYNADPQNPGYIWLRAPISGVVLTADFQQTLKGQSVKESQPLLRIGKYDPRKNDAKDWELELKIPQKHLGQVLQAFERIKKGEELDVDILLTSEPTRMYKGKLSRDKIAAEATPNKDDNSESEPVTIAWVRLSGTDIPAGYQLRADNLVAGSDVRTRIRCGNRPMGYSLFYGVWEFFYEKIVFFF